MEEETRHHSSPRVPTMQVHIGIAVIACISGILLAWLTAEEPLPEAERKDVSGTIRQKIEQGVIKDYSYQLRAQLSSSSIQVPNDFATQVAEVLRGQLESITLPYGNFPLVKGKELLTRTAGESVPESLLEILGLTTSEIDLRAIVDKLKEPLKVAAQEDADRIKKCGIEILEGQPPSCWIKQLKNGKESAREKAINALAEKKDYSSKEVISSLGKALEKDPKASVRRAAAAALGEINLDAKDAKDASNFLLQALTRDKDPEVRRLAVQSLADIGQATIDVSETLAETQKSDPDEKVRKAAESALKKLQER